MKKVVEAALTVILVIVVAVGAYTIGHINGREHAVQDTTKAVTEGMWPEQNVINFVKTEFNEWTK